MNCRHVQNWLGAFIDGEMAGGDMLNVRCHLLNCPVCAKEEQELRLLKRRLRDYRSVEPAANLDDRIMTHIRVQTAARQRPRSWYLPIIAGMAAAAAVLGGVVGAAHRQATSGETVATEINSDASAYTSADPLGGVDSAMASNNETR
jgi:anti-sigma factor RsiW